MGRKPNKRPQKSRSGSEQDNTTSPNEDNPGTSAATSRSVEESVASVAADLGKASSDASDIAYPGSIVKNSDGIFIKTFAQPVPATREQLLETAFISAREKYLGLGSPKTPGEHAQVIIGEPDSSEVGTWYVRLLTSQKFLSTTTCVFASRTLRFEK